jgi:PEP-CTERM motif
MTQPPLPPLPWQPETGIPHKHAVAFFPIRRIIATISHMNPKSKYVLSAIAAMLSVSAHAQTVVASDNAGNYTSWPQTANNGSGFGNWSYNNTTPDGGYSGQFLGASGNINSGNGDAFGFYANSGSTQADGNSMAQAIAPFSEGSLTANQTFSIQMQNGNVTDNGGQVGFSLQNNSGNNIFQFYFNGGESDYYLNVYTAQATPVQIDTGVGYTAGAMTLDFTQGSGDAWSFSFYEGSTLENTLTSSGTGDLLWANTISQANLYSLNGGSSRTLGDNGNLFFNNLEITSVPEPSSLVLCGLSGLATLLVVRRRK